MYGCDTWTIREAERKRLEALEMWCNILLRPILLPLRWSQPCYPHGAVLFFYKIYYWLAATPAFGVPLASQGAAPPGPPWSPALFPLFPPNPTPGFLEPSLNPSPIPPPQPPCTPLCTLLPHTTPTNIKTLYSNERKLEDNCVVIASVTFAQDLEESKKIGSLCFRPQNKKSPIFQLKGQT